MKFIDGWLLVGLVLPFFDVLALCGGVLLTEGNGEGTNVVTPKAISVRSVRDKRL